MGEIARAAGVSKGTLYVYFADKNSLFCEDRRAGEPRQGMLSFDFSPDRDVETTLRAFGAAYIALMCRPRGGSAIRTVMAIAERMPEIGQRYYERVIAHTISRFARLSRAHVRPARCASTIASSPRRSSCRLCQATLFLPFIFQAAEAPSPERIERGGRQRHADVPRRLSGAGASRTNRRRNRLVDPGTLGRQRFSRPSEPVTPREPLLA